MGSNVREWGGRQRPDHIRSSYQHRREVRRLTITQGEIIVAGLWKWPQKFCNVNTWSNNNNNDIITTIITAAVIIC